MKALHWLKTNWLQTVILVIPFIVVVAFWNSFPDRVVVQWNSSGPSKLADKMPGLLICPFLSLGLAIIFGWIPRLDPKLSRNPDSNHASIVILRLFSTTLISAGGVLIAAEALGYHSNVPVLAINGMLLSFLVVGNYLGTLRPNYFFGIKTPWTLENEAVWRATNRNGGRVLVAGSLIFLGLQFVLTPAHLGIGFLAFICTSFAWSYFYSYLLFRSAKHESP